MKIRAIITVEMEVHEPVSVVTIQKGLEYIFEPGIQMELEYRGDDGVFIDKVITIEPLKCEVTIDG